MAALQPPTEDQFAGALLGCAVGDALGAWIEGRSRTAIAELDNLVSHYRPFREYPAGQFTDDTQLTVATAKSMVRKHGVDGADIAQEIAQLWRDNTIIGAGPVAKRAINKIIEGVDWQEAADPGDLPFNGAAMRISPLGLWYAGESNSAMREGVRIASLVTHGHPVGIDAAVVTARAVAQAAGTKHIETRPFLEDLAISAETEPLQTSLIQLADWMALSESEALAAIVDATQEQRMEGFGINVMAVPTILAALYCFLMTPDDYIATIDCALRVGGDVDTVAAIAGAISGARHGVGAIPSNLRESLIDGDEIEALGRALYAARPRG